METRESQAHCAWQALDLAEMLGDHLFSRNENAFYGMMIGEIEAQQARIDILDGDDDVWEVNEEEFFASLGNHSEQKDTS